MISRRHHFEIAFSSVPEPVVDVWRTLVSVLAKAKCLPSKFNVQQITGHPKELMSEQRLILNPSQIENLISLRNLDAFFVDTDYSPTGVCYSMQHLKEQGRQSVLNCRIENKAKVPDDWTPLIEAMMTQWPSIGGWQWNYFYRAWQCTQTFSRYVKVFGTPPPDTQIFIKKSSCALIPDEKMIDISMNPGRIKELLIGVHFYPTAEMWLGPHFWQYAKCTKEEALAADFFIEKRDSPHFLYLKCWPHPFTRPDGEQGRMQQRLWKLFFHEDCEWPPDSGTICDEAMYGPPELMP